MEKENSLTVRKICGIKEVLRSSSNDVNLVENGSSTNPVSSKSWAIADILAGNGDNVVAI
ncbi:hypothetical protein LOAG_04494 [Loa loa]|uniref:Uncharacterized protein n=1 Tax=Loa loa TaxID=7209 RepID=A0A1S0U3V5_LOALO|nr:hypothetical protein LOAG_04494 [Loa loa]EFO23990.1 hypothetical protein LOAG_04494 [Loa loa]